MQFVHACFPVCSQNANKAASVAGFFFFHSFCLSIFLSIILYTQWNYGNWTLEILFFPFHASVKNLVHWELVLGNPAVSYLMSSKYIYIFSKPLHIKISGAGPNAPSKKLCIRQLSIPNKMVCSILGCYPWPHGNACFHRLCNNPGNRYLKTNASLVWNLQQ